MPALASQILTAVAATLEGLFPAVPVRVRRASEKHPLLSPGEAVPAIVVTGNEGQRLTGGTATKVFSEYKVAVTYLTKELPGGREESSTAREAQEAIRKAFDVAAYAAVPSVSQIDPEVQKPYSLPLKDQTVNCSAVVLAVETYEARN